MKTLNKKIIVVFLFSMYFVQNSFGQSFSNVGSASANFLKIPVESAGAALGSSNVATDQGILGLYSNPGALAYTKGTEILLSQVRWLADTRLSYLGIVNNFGVGSIGLSVTALTMDQMEITTETNPAGTGEYFNSGSYAFGLSYGIKVIDKFSFGGTIKYVYEYIWDTHASTYLFDFGSVYQTDFYNMRIGMRLANFGGNIAFSGEPIDNKPQVITQSGISYPYDPRLDRVSSEYPLPQLFNVGVSFDPLQMDEHRLTVYAAINDPNDNNTQLLFGSEYVWQDLLFMRLGYKSGFDEQDISAGIGVKIKFQNITPQFDFAYSSFGDLGSIIYFNLRIGI